MSFVPLDKNTVLSLIETGRLVAISESDTVVTYRSQITRNEVHELFEEINGTEVSQFYGEANTLSPNWKPVSTDQFNLLVTMGDYKLHSEDTRRRVHYLEGIPALQEIFIGETKSHFAVIDAIVTLDPEPFTHSGGRYPMYVGSGTRFAPRGIDGYSVNPVDYLLSN